MQAMLDFEQAPPISVPYRFFLGGPLFAAAAGLLLAWLGPDAFLSRWSPPLMAVLHLLTIGFMLQIMLGALLQVLPVAAGANVRRSRLLAGVSQTGLVVGTAFLAYGFAGGGQLPFRLAIPLLCGALAIYVLVCGHALVITKAKGATVLALRLALAALVPTVALGALLASGFGWERQLPMMALVAAHVAWAFLGWSLLLVMAVAYLVVPMFQLTPPYRPRLALFLPWAVVACLLLWSLLELALPVRWGRVAVALVLAGLVAAFALVTLDLQRKRRRKQGDATLRFWRLGMLVLVLVAGLGALSMLLGDPQSQERIEILAGVLLVAGVLMPLINGMIYKIVPFLNWLHLQKRVFPVPNMKHMLPEKAMAGQFWLHGAALAALTLAVFLPMLVIPAGLLLAASSLWLEWNLAGAVRRYRRLASAGGARQGGSK